MIRIEFRMLWRPRWPIDRIVHLVTSGDEPTSIDVDVPNGISLYEVLSMSH